MKHQGTLTAIVGALAVFGWSAPVAAQQADFTISVPVELHSLHPDISAFFVICAIYANEQAVAGNLTQGPQQFPVDADGNYLGPPVAIEVNAPDASIAQKAAANMYTCGLRLVRATGGTFAPTENSTSDDGRPKPGTTFTRQISGTFVQGG